MNNRFKVWFGAAVILTWVWAVMGADITFTTPLVQDTDASWQMPTRTAAHLAEMANKSMEVKWYPLVVDTSGAYAVGDQWSVQLVCTNAMRITNGAAVLQDVILYVPQSSTPALKIWISPTELTTNALNAAWIGTNLLACRKPISMLSTDYDGNTNKIGEVSNIGRIIYATNDTRRIFVLITANDTTQMTNQPWLGLGLLY